MRKPTINFHRVGRQSLTSLKLRRLFDIYRIEKQNLIELELRFLSFKHHYFDPVYYLFSMNFMTRRQLLYEYKKECKNKRKKQKYFNTISALLNTDLRRKVLPSVNALSSWVLSCQKN